MARVQVGIFGGSGYGGSELLRILLFHPGVDVAFVAANKWVGRRVDEAHPNLRGLTDLTFSGFESSLQIEHLDCLFLGLPHGRSMELVPGLPEDLKIIDLAGDFRLRDGRIFEKYYGKAHPSLDLQKEFVYGFTEINRKALVKTRRVANPGCFATAVLIGLYPLISHSLTRGRIVADAKTGSSGSGATAVPGTHHPVRSSSFCAYKSFSHQHLPEIVQTLREVTSSWDGPLILQTHSAPMVRGIFASIYCVLDRPTTAEQIGEVFEAAYDGSGFIRLVSSPNVAWVKNSNFADVGWAVDGRDLIVFVALDNLMKGAAGQAVQNMNLMFGWSEETGLRSPGGHP